MDQLSKRLRKQRERSSLHARQLNKNATSILNRQLRVLERREQQNARVHIRKRQALLMELNDFDEPEHEQAKLGDRPTRIHPAHLPALGTSRGLSRESPPQPPSKDIFESVVARDSRPTCKNHLRRVSDLASSPTSNIHLSSSANMENNSGQICRFRALSPLNPCPFFPCSRPKSYHSLGATDFPRFSVLQRGKNLINNPSASSVNSAISSSVLTGQGSGLPRGRSSSATVVRGMDGHIAARTSINDRLRGLRQLVRELRGKNEEKKPRAWEINYGDPMCKRLLRKPAIPVSDELVLA